MRSLLFPARPTIITLTNAYDRAADTWHRTISRIGFVDAYGEFLDRIGRHRLANQSNRLSVLDAGCGTAAFSLALGRRHSNADFDLLDISEGMLERAAQNLSAEGFASGQLCCDVRELANRAKRYDIVLSAHLIEHCDDPGCVVSALRDALRPGGLLIMVVSKPHWCTALVRLRWGHRAYRPKELTTLLRTHGFNGVQSYGFSSGPPKRLSAGYIAVKSQGLTA